MKTGRPYVVHRKASNWRQNLERESNGIRWGSSLYRFFRTVRFESHHANVADCYLALADQVEHRLGALHPYFVRLAEAMRVWMGLWYEFARGEAGRRKRGRPYPGRVCPANPTGVSCGSPPEVNESSDLVSCLRGLWDSKQTSIPKRGSSFWISKR